jgi:hypothetical protein
MTVKKGIYRHFKGHEYRVFGIAKHSETLEEYVVYINVKDDNDIWIRPESMFLELVTREGKTFPRFELIEEL